MVDMDPAGLRKTLDQIDRAAQEHAEWHANVLRSIVCETPCDPNDLTASAHLLCRFGHWYYEQSAAEIREDPVFAAIGVEHRLVHRIAARILREVAAGRPVDREDFDDMLAGSARLRGELDMLRRDVQGALRHRDERTGAFDRGQVLPELRHWRALVKQGVQPCCIAFMDLDHLADINRKHGHPTGDAVLAAAVRYLRDHLRPASKVFRYGGDEFLISLPGADFADAHELIKRVRHGLATDPLSGLPVDLEYPVTASFGLARLDPDARVEDSIERAAHALLIAKSSGGDRAINWDESVITRRDLRRLEVDRHET
jgi:diguanylate cyclase (GGDEF)-like protein